MSTAIGVLVPTAPTPTTDETIEYALEQCLAHDGDVTLYVITTVPRSEESRPNAGEQFLQRVADRTGERAPARVSVRTKRLGTDRYLADPTDHVSLLQTLLSEAGIDSLVLDPNHSVDATAPSLQPMEAALVNADIDFEHAPISGGRLQITASELRRGVAVAVLMFGFYLLLTDPTARSDILFGAGVAAVAGLLLRNVTFETTPKLHAMPMVFIRALLVTPYLLWKIIIANFQFAYVVLHPSLPIEPWLDRIDTRVDDGLSVTAFANSLTLTPGTLTVDADGNRLLVHSLNESTRADLLDGNRERAIRFVFYGRSGLDLDSIDDRGDAVVVVGPKGQKATRGEDSNE